jgi:LTXXQ motif family protein
MLKIVALGLAAFFIAGSSLAYAQAAAPAEERFTAADWNALTDARIGVVKAALQLKPDQTKYWPAIEDAIRARATMRQEHIAALKARVAEKTEFQPVDFIRARADYLAQRADSLKKLADAWQPLYATLDADQKRRMRLLSMHVLHEFKEAVISRRMHEEDEDED